MKRNFFAVLSVGLLAVAATACSSSGSGNTPTSASTASATNGSSSSCPSGMQTFVTGLPGYQVCLFAASTTDYSHPDSIVVSGSTVYVGYQNITAKDGADKKTSTIVAFDMHGKVLKKFTILGHNDGLRMNPTTHQLWAVCNEDGNPNLFTIDPASGKVTRYSLPHTPHGGGFDDIQFVNGKSLIDASNPTLNSAGVNVFPALYTVQLAGSSAKLTPVLQGDATALNLLPPVAKTTLNLVDPDSMEITPQGDLLFDNQGGSQLLFIHNPGTPGQKVSQLPVGTEVDDTVFASSAKGCLLVADNGAGVYSICSTQFVPGTLYAAAPNDSGVQGFVGTISLGSGYVVPLIVGLNNPHGMAFVPNVSRM